MARGGYRKGGGRPAGSVKAEGTRKQRQMRAYDDEWELIQEFAKMIKHGQIDKCKDFLSGGIKMDNKIKIELTEEAHIEGHEGAFFRNYSEDGKQLATGIWDNWYEAHGRDAAGNEYLVVWTIKANPVDMEDESNNCDWERPAIVLTETNRNVTDKVILAL